MKKILSIIILLVTFTGWSNATSATCSQLPLNDTVGTPDTVRTIFVGDSSYYYSKYKEQAANAYVAMNFWMQDPHYSDFAIGGVTSEKIKVRGIAAALFSPSYDAISNVRVLDTALSHVYDSLALYVPDSVDKIKCLARSFVHLKETKPAYYLDIKDSIPGNLYIVPDQYPVPLFECYFDKSVVVEDTFYLGLTNHTMRYESEQSPFDDEDEVYIVKKRAICTIDLLTTIPEQWQVCVRYAKDSKWATFKDNKAERLMMFPLLDENQNFDDNDTTQVDDTTQVVDTTTNAIGMNDLLSRYVTLSPNPATEKVRITSNFGLLQIDIFDATGTPVRSAPATGLAVSVDVSTLPQGMYMVRISTPIGITTRKLLVQRK